MSGTSIDVDFLTLRNITAYNPDGSFVEGGKILSIGSNGQGIWNDEVSSLSVSSINVNNLTAENIDTSTITTYYLKSTSSITVGSGGVLISTVTNTSNVNGLLTVSTNLFTGHDLFLFNGTPVVLGDGSGNFWSITNGSDIVNNNGSGNVSSLGLFTVVSQGANITGQTNLNGFLSTTGNARINGYLNVGTYVSSQNVSSYNTTVRNITDTAYLNVRNTISSIGFINSRSNIIGNNVSSIGAMLAGSYLSTNIIRMNNGDISGVSSINGVKYDPNNDIYWSTIGGYVSSNTGALPVKIGTSLSTNTINMTNGVLTGISTISNSFTLIGGTGYTDLTVGSYSGTNSFINSDQSGNLIINGNNNIELTSNNNITLNNSNTNIVSNSNINLKSFGSTEISSSNNIVLNSNNNVLLTCNALNGSLDLSGSFSTIGSVSITSSLITSSLSTNVINMINGVLNGVSSIVMSGSNILNLKSIQMTTGDISGISSIHGSFSTIGSVSITSSLNTSSLNSGSLNSGSVSSNYIEMILGNINGISSITSDDNISIDSNNSVNIRTDNNVNITTANMTLTAYNITRFDVDKLLVNSTRDTKFTANSMEFTSNSIDFIGSVSITSSLNTSSLTSGSVSTNSIRMISGDISGISSINGVKYDTNNDTYWSTIGGYVSSNTGVLPVKIGTSLSTNTINMTNGILNGLDTINSSLNLANTLTMTNGNSIINPTIIQGYNDSFIYMNDGNKLKLSPGNAGDLELNPYSGGKVVVNSNLSTFGSISITSSLITSSLISGSVSTNTINMTNGVLNGISTISDSFTVKGGPGYTNLILGSYSGSNNFINSDNTNQLNIFSLGNTLINSNGTMTLSSDNNIQLITGASIDVSGSSIINILSLNGKYTQGMTFNNQDSIILGNAGGNITIDGSGNSYIYSLNYTAIKSTLLFSNIYSINLSATPISTLISNPNITGYVRVYILAIGAGGNGVSGGGGGSGQEVIGVYYVTVNQSITITCGVKSTNTNTSVTITNPSGNHNIIAYNGLDASGSNGGAGWFGGGGSSSGVGGTSLMANGFGRKGADGSGGSGGNGDSPSGTTGGGASSGTYGGGASSSLGTGGNSSNPGGLGAGGGGNGGTGGGGAVFIQIFGC